MKVITNIQSFSDVITNSSSTVFLMYKDDAKYYENNVPGDCCTIEEITESWLKDHIYEWGFIFEFLNIDKTEVSVEQEAWWSKGNTYWEDPDPDIWELWVEKNRTMLQDKLYGLYFVDIEDHFEDSWEYINSIEHSSDNLFSDYRH